MKLRLKDSFGMVPVGTRTPSSAIAGSSGEGVGSSTRNLRAEAALNADEGVRVPRYRVIGTNQMMA